MALSYSDSAALMTDTTFRGRIKVAMLKFAGSVVNEAPTTAAHNSRYRWAQQAMSQPDQWSQTLQPNVVMDPNVQSNGSAVDDAGLQGAVEAVINEFI